MFNKFVREQLFHTNRHNPSRDVALRFGWQELLKHMIDGGSWVSCKSSRRTRNGQSIQEFIGRDETAFRMQFFGAREYSENSYDPIPTILKAGFSGVFEEKEGGSFFVGVVGVNNTVQKYTLMESNDDGPLLCQASEEYPLSLSEVTALGILDMFQSDTPTTMYINTNTFGSITLLNQYIPNTP